MPSQNAFPPPHKLHGRCPDNEPCWFVQVPCSQMCSRLQPGAIAAELQAQVRLAKGAFKDRPDRRRA